jgi:hypothetical protein
VWILTNRRKDVIIDYERQNEMADALIQKLERIKELWEQLPTEDDLEELEQHAAGVAASLEHASATYMDGDFPTVDSIQELAKVASLLATDLERCERDDETDEDGGPQCHAKAAAEFVQSCMFHYSRGALDCGDKIVVFGNDGYDPNSIIHAEVELVQEHLEKLGLSRKEFGTSTDGYSWAVVAMNYDGLPIDIHEVEQKLHKIWNELRKAG